MAQPTSILSLGNKPCATNGCRWYSVRWELGRLEYESTTRSGGNPFIVTMPNECRLGWLCWYE